MKLRPKEEKDCTDQLLECTTDCDPKDKECETLNKVISNIRNEQ